MRVRTTVYEVPLWGTGTLWTDGELVLAHDFDYRIEGAAHVAFDGAVADDATARDAALHAVSLHPAPLHAVRLVGASPEAAGLAAADAGAGAAGSGPAPHAAAPHAAAPHGAAPQGAAPHKGGASPPGATLEEIPSHVGHAFVQEARRSSAVADHRPYADDATLEIVARLVAFFSGEDALRDVPIDLSWCTPFQRDAVEVLRRIPRGEVVSYGELSALAGRPGAQRAVGTLCARNRFALLVPCHRVVAADGIGGYGSTGVAVKRRLLALEGVRL